jgi:Bacteriophage lambda head decoration protein D
MGNPQVTPINENWHDGGFIVSEANGHRSRDQITVKSGAKLQAGTVLGKITLGTASETHAGNTGNGAMGAITVGATAKPGVYTLKITKAATNAGDFEVFDPTGELCGVGSVAAAFSGGGLSFTLADGATDFIVGDTFLITVAAGSGKYVACNPTNTDGSQIAAAILYGLTDATNVDKAATAVVRSSEINASELVYDASFSSTPLKNAALAQLATLGIIAR